MKKEVSFLVMADTHLGHDRMVSLCHRPSDFNEQILDNISRYTHDNSVLILLGDFAFYKHKLWASRFFQALKGQCWLILGNHDKKSMSWYLMNGFSCVADIMSMTMYGQKILFSHRPYFHLERDQLNIHGHLHQNQHHTEYGNSGISDNHLLICSEHDYKPYSLKDILQNRNKPSTIAE